MTIPWRNHIITLANAVIIFIVLLLTLSNSSYICEVESNGSEDTCQAHGFREDETEMCQGTVFLISAQAGTKDVKILCPWGTGTVTFTTLGAVAAFIYTVIVLLQYVKPLSQKVIMIAGFLSFPLLLTSTILMLTGISDGGKKCEDFEEDLSELGFQGHCSNAAYGIDFILSMIGMLIFGYETLQAFFAYKYGTRQIDYNYKDYEDFTQYETEREREQDMRTFHLPEDD